jgi:hypothetical protein
MSSNVGGVRKISDDTVVKPICDTGVEASSFVRVRTTIPIPRVRRTIRDEEGNTLIVMDYIPGERLDRVWPSLSVWSKLWVALILRR